MTECGVGWWGDEIRSAMEFDGGESLVHDGTMSLVRRRGEKWGMHSASDDWGLGTFL
jgi:hypothetical protein